MIKDYQKDDLEGEERFYLDLITHDIRNLNQGVQGYLELMTMMSDTTERQRVFLEEVLGYVRMSSSLLNSIELVSRSSVEDLVVDLHHIVQEANEYINSFNVNVPIDIGVEGLEGELVVHGNILLTEVILFLMDFMVKRSQVEVVRLNIRVMRFPGHLIKVIIEGNFEPLSKREAAEIFVDREKSSGNWGGKLLLCRSILDRFGGRISYRVPSNEGNFPGGGFMLTLREVQTLPP